MFKSSLLGLFSASALLICTFGKASSLQVGNRNIAMAPVECLEELKCDGTPARIRVLMGYNNFDIEERLEVVLYHALTLREKKSGNVQLKNPLDEGSVCFRNFDPERSQPKHRSYCLSPLKGPDTCSVDYKIDNSDLELSLKCDSLRRAISPNDGDTVSFATPKGEPISCRLKQVTPDNCIGSAKQ